jgi:Uma2 family endonuclease
MTEQRTLLTADEFFRLYSGKDGYYELVRGEVIELAPPNWEHGEVALSIGSALRIFVRQRGLGTVVVESGYRLESQPDTVRGPDVSFVSRDRVPAGGPVRTFFPGVPDLAVEVVSPSDTAAEIEAKVHDYLRTGVRRVWVAYPNTRRVAVHFPDGSARWYSEDEAIEDPDLLLGFSLSLREIFGP